MRLLDRLKERDAVGTRRRRRALRGRGAGHHDLEGTGAAHSHLQVADRGAVSNHRQVRLQRVGVERHAQPQAQPRHADSAPRLPHRGPRRRGSHLEPRIDPSDSHRPVRRSRDGPCSCRRRRAHTRRPRSDCGPSTRASTASSGPVGVLESANQRLYYRKVQLYGAVERVLAAAAPQAILLGAHRDVAVIRAATPRSRAASLRRAAPHAPPHSFSPAGGLPRRARDQPGTGAAVAGAGHRSPADVAPACAEVELTVRRDGGQRTRQVRRRDRSARRHGRLPCS